MSEISQGKNLMTSIFQNVDSNSKNLPFGKADQKINLSEMQKRQIDQKCQKRRIHFPYKNTIYS